MPVRILDPEAFYPIDYWQVWQLIRSGKCPRIATRFICGMRSGRRKDSTRMRSMTDGCIFEQLKRRYGVASPPGAAQGPGWLPLGRYGLRRLKARLRSRRSRAA